MLADASWRGGKVAAHSTSVIRWMGWIPGSVYTQTKSIYAERKECIEVKR